jgi:hypothetical protein
VPRVLVICKYAKPDVPLPLILTPPVVEAFGVVTSSRPDDLITEPSMRKLISSDNLYPFADVDVTVVKLPVFAVVEPIAAGAAHVLSNSVVALVNPAVKKAVLTEIPEEFTTIELSPALALIVPVDVIVVPGVNSIPLPDVSEVIPPPPPPATVDQ